LYLKTIFSNVQSQSGPGCRLFDWIPLVCTQTWSPRFSRLHPAAS